MQFQYIPLKGVQKNLFVILITTHQIQGRNMSKCNRFFIFLVALKHSSTRNLISSNQNS